MTASPDDLLDFLNRAPSPYHAARTVAERLSQSGFVEFDERKAWQLEAGQRAFVQRAGASLIAFEMGHTPPCEAGFRVIGAHTDSPNLRLKPNFELRNGQQLQLSVEPYGGLLLHTWLDRPLALAGRIVTREGAVHLVHIDRGIVTIPSLAIHLQREIGKQGLVLNPQQHLRPLFGLDAAPSAPFPLLPLLSDTLGIAHLANGEQSAFAAFDLCLLDAEKAAFVGINNDYIASGRIDNLVSAYAGLHALLAPKDAVSATRVLVLYDHEEVGSRSYAGAQSTFLGDVLTRLAQSFAPTDFEATPRAMAQSLLLSADMAHAVHPNYSDKHDDLHRPVLGKGPVLKSNTGQSYATDSVSAAALFSAATRAELELQRFVTRNDMPCGSTIGPLAAARQGIRTVDVGNPMLAMHSCRELCATSDLLPYVRLMTEWYQCPAAHSSHL